METNNIDPKKKRVFLSYHEENVKSAEIVKQLGEFLKNWEIECFVMKWEEQTDPPKEKINKALAVSDYLLQLFTDWPKASKWMKIEWEAANSFLYAKEKRMHRPIVLFTDETNVASRSFGEIKRERDKGTILAVRVNEAIPTLYGLMVECGIFKKQHGEIVFPMCCRPGPTPEKIELGHVGHFIQNFSEANRRGLECIYPDRSAAMEVLKNKFGSLRKGEKIRMLGVTLNRYVYPNNPKGIGKTFEATIKRGVRAYILILDPKCQAAKERADIESLGIAYKESLFFVDNQAVKSYYANSNFRNKVEITTYNSPYVGLVLFKDEVYIELYHIAEELRDANLCGHVPVLVARKDSIYYQLFNSHFESLWPKSIPLIPFEAKNPPRQKKSK